MTVSIPEGVDKHFSSRETRASALEGRAVMRDLMGRGLGCLAEGAEAGIGSPEGRSAIGTGATAVISAVALVSGADSTAGAVVSAIVMLLFFFVL